MAKRRPSARLVKQHRSYTIAEAANCLGVAMGTIRRWAKEGLPVMDGQKPFLITGSALKHFLEKQTKQKQPCAPHEFFCFRCRAPKTAAGGMIDYIARNDRTGRLSAICDACGTIMHKSYSAARLHELEGQAEVSFPQGPRHLTDSVDARPNDHFRKETKA